MTRRASRHGNFTASEAAVRWRCKEEVATEFLEHFAALGLVELCEQCSSNSRWRVTERGYRLGCALSTFDSREGLIPAGINAGPVLIREAVL